MLIKEDLVLKMLEQLNLTQATNTKLKNYYEGKHKILNDKPKVDDTRSDVRIIFEYPTKIVNNYTGYMLGKPLSYVSKSGNDEFLSKIDTWYSFWEKSQNIKLKQVSETYGSAFEVVYINPDGEFQCACFSPLDSMVLYDGTVEQNISMLVRKYKVQFDETEYVDVWDRNGYTKYSLTDGKLSLIDTKQNLFSTCPVIEYQANDLRKSSFENIISILDAYERVYSDATNEIADHRNAYLVIEGADLTPEAAQKMKQNGIILTPKDSKVYWAVKNINGQFVKDVAKDLQDEVYIQTNQANLNESFQSNTSGVSIRLKLQELENLCAIKESHFEKALKKRLKLFCEWLRMKELGNFDYRDISIAFTRNVPVDEKSIADMVVALQGILPNEVLISWLPRVENPSAMIKKLAEEKKLQAEQNKYLYADFQLKDTKSQLEDES